MLKKNKPYRNKKYLAWIKKHPCCVCGKTPSDPAHQSYQADGGMGIKCSDLYVVPLCRECHAIQHGVGETDFWYGHGRTMNVDRYKVAVDMIVKYLKENGGI